MSAVQPPCGPPAEDRFRYVPFLDGLRAIAILSVLGFHKMGPISHAISDFFRFSGVDVFFILSGFLITSLLLQDLKDEGTVDLKWFYTRRTLRIWPMCFAVVIALLVLRKINWYTAGTAATFLINYDLAYNWGNGIWVACLWSLGVEEQFYLFWPLALLLFRKRPLAVSIGVIALVWAWRGARLLAGAHWLTVAASFDLRLDVLMFGCLAAILWARPETAALVRRALSPRWVPWVLVVLALGVAQTFSHPSVPGKLRQFLLWQLTMPLFFAFVSLFILSLMCQQDHPIARFLSWSPLRALGVLSYSLYLVHGHLFQEIRLAVAGPPAYGFKGVFREDVTVELLNFLGGLALATVCYYTIERPFLALKHYFEPRPRQPEAEAAPEAGQRQAA